jgi:transcription antitermination factor NusG
VVTVIDGPFESLEGAVETINEFGKVTVSIEIFGARTPVELELWQLQKS